MSKRKLSEVEKNQQIYNDFVKTLEGKFSIFSFIKNFRK